MIAFSFALNEIKNIPTEKIQAFSIGLGILIGAIAVSLLIAQNMSLGGAMKGILILSAAVAALMAVFAIVGKFAMNTLGSGLTSLGANLKTFSGMLGDFDKRMDNVDESSVEKAKLIIGMIVDMLSDLGGIVVGSISSSALTTITSHLMLTSGMMIDFGVRMSLVDISAFTKAHAIIEQIKLMMGALDDFDKYTGRREAFTTALFDLGTGIEIFASHTGNVGDLSNNSALQLIKDLSACAGDLDTIAKMNLDGLTSSMTGLGGAMMLYAKGAEEATGIETGAEGAPDVQGAVKLLRDISNSLVENGGFTIPENMPSEDALGTFGAQLAALAGALVMFEDAGSKLGDGTDKAISCLDFFEKLKTKLTTINLGEALGALMTSFVTGEDVVIQPNELETFGKNIEQLGLALAAFAKSTTVVDDATGEITPVDYSVAIEALESFASLSDKLPTIGGIRAWWEGNKQSLTDLGADLEALGQGLKDFSLKVTGKSDDNYEGFAADTIEEGKTATTTVVDKAVEVFNNIVDAQSKLQNVGGIESIWSGDPPSFQDIGTQLTALGQSLKDFSMSVTGDNDSTYKGFGVQEVEEIEKGKTESTSIVDKAVEVFTKIVEIQGKLQEFGNIGGIASIWNGDPPDLSSLGGQIGTLGQGLGSFIDAVMGKDTEGKSFDPTAADGALSVIDSMIKVMQDIGTKLPKIGGIGNFFNTLSEGRSTTLSDVGTQIGGLGDGLSGFATAIKGKFKDSDEIINALNVVSKVVDMIASLASVNDSISYSNLGTYIDYIYEFINGLTTDTSQREGNHDKTMVQALVDMMSSISEAMDIAGNIDSKNLDIFATFTQSLNNLANTNFEETIKSFESVGENISLGVQRGINNGSSEVVKSAVNMAVLAYTSACAALGIKSPSRLFMSMGAYVSEGMAIGISKSADQASDASVALAEGTIDSAKSILANVSSILASDVDSQPTIRPVLDLSNVTAGARTIGGMFGDYGVGLDTSGVNSRASRTFSPREVDVINQNGTDTESMFARMDGMLESIQKMGDSIANMKLVLDTGVLAGGVSDDVDVDIGRKMFYAGRRN